MSLHCAMPMYVPHLWFPPKSQPAIHTCSHVNYFFSHSSTPILQATSTFWPEWVRFPCRNSKRLIQQRLLLPCNTCPLVLWNPSQSRLMNSSLLTMTEKRRHRESDVILPLLPPLSPLLFNLLSTGSAFVWLILTWFFETGFLFMALAATEPTL